MNKRILSLALALILSLAVIPAAIAAETVVTDDFVITNVLREAWYEVYEDGEPMEYELGEWIVAEGATLKFSDSAPAWDDTEVRFFVNPTVKDNGGVEWTWSGDWENAGIDSGKETALKTNAAYYISVYGYVYVLDAATAAIFTGSPAPSAPAPTPAPTPTPEPAPVPAPSIPATGNTAALVTADRLVTVIPPNPAAGQDLMYTVQPGETLWGIAFNYYGSMQKAVIDRIYTANREYFQRTKNVLEAGAVIKLPASGLRNPVTQGSLNEAAGMYLVRAGDTLGTIAKHFYGDANQWRKIYEANKDRVKNANIIYEKQWLVIPQ